MQSSTVLTLEVWSSTFEISREWVGGSWLPRTIRIHAFSVTWEYLYSILKCIQAPFIPTINIYVLACKWITCPKIFQTFLYIGLVSLKFHKNVLVPGISSSPWAHGHFRVVNAKNSTVLPTYLTYWCWLLENYWHTVQPLALFSTILQCKFIFLLRIRIPRYGIPCHIISCYIWLFKRSIYKL